MLRANSPQFLSAPQRPSIQQNRIERAQVGLADLTDCADHYLRQLSGGEEQRVGIVAGLAPAWQAARADIVESLRAL